MLTKSFIYKLYIIKKLSLREIGEKYNIGDRHKVSKLLKQYNIKTRTSCLVTKGPYLTKQYLYREYIKNKKSLNKLGLEIGVDPATVGKYIKKYNIKLRTKKENIQLYAYRRLQNKTGNGPRKYKIIELSRILNIEEPEIAYFIGFVAGDGTIYKIQKHHASSILKINIATKDRYLLRKFLRLLKTNHPLRAQKVYLGVPQTLLHIQQHGIAEAFRIHGITPKKSLILEFPKKLDRHLRRHYIRGLFDADGCIFLRNANGKKKLGGISISSGSINLINGLKRELNKSNIRTTINKRILKSGRDFFNLHISNKDLELFYKYLYKGASLFLKRKKNKFELSLKNRR